MIISKGQLFKSCLVCDLLILILLDIKERTDRFSLQTEDKVLRIAFLGAFYDI